jgi:hypothetical protein
LGANLIHCLLTPELTLTCGALYHAVNFIIVLEGSVYDQNLIDGELTERLNLIPGHLRCKFIFTIGINTFEAVFCGVVLRNHQQTVRTTLREGKKNLFHRALRSELTAALGTLALMFCIVMLVI